MVKRIFVTALVAILLLSSNLFGAYGRRYYSVTFYDEWDEPVTSLTSVSFYLATTATAATIYADASSSTEVGTSGVVTSGISDGTVEFWYSASTIKFTATDGTYTRTMDNWANTTVRVAFPSYLSEMSAYSLSDSQDLIFGTGSDWTLDSDTAATLDCEPGANNSIFAIGRAGTYTSDFELYGASYDIMWDANRNHLLFEDNAICGFGGTNDSAADYKFYTAGSTSNLIITAISADDAVEFGDGTIATDVKFQNTTTAGADIWWDDSGEIWHFGVTNTGVDVKFWGDATGDYMLWDESEDELVFEDCNVVLNEGTDLIFQDSGDATDWKVECATAERLAFIPTEITDDQAFHIGNATNTSDVKIFGATASYAEFDASADKLILDAYDIRLQDSDILNFGDADDIFMSFDGSNFKIDAITADEGLQIGDITTGFDFIYYFEGAGQFRSDYDGDFINLTDDMEIRFGTGASADGDFKISSNSSDVLQLEQVSVGTGTIEIGVNDDGIDLKLWADTSGNYIVWDEDGSTDGALIFEDSSIKMMDDTTIIFGDGSDVTLQYDENGGDALQVTGSFYGWNRVVTHILASATLADANSGQVVYVAKAGAGAAADIVITLPTAVAGLEYVIIDANETAAADVTIQTASGDKINDGSAAAKYVHDTDADNYAACYILAIDATDWVVVSETGTWANE